MKRTNLRRTLLAAARGSAAVVGVATLADAQGGVLIAEEDQVAIMAQERCGIIFLSGDIDLRVIRIDLFPRRAAGKPGAGLGLSQIELVAGQRACNIPVLIAPVEVDSEPPARVPFQRC